MMGIFLRTINVTLIAVLFICLGSVTGSDGLVCTGDTYFFVRKSGREICKACNSCKHAGYGLNKTENRLEDENGFLSCYPCEKCPDGTFRELDSAEPKCLPCALDCLRLNRYNSIKCGGANSGHCGDCFSGYDADSKEPNSICTTDEKKSTTIRDEWPLPSSTSPQRGSQEDNMEEDEVHTINAFVFFPAILTILLLLCAVVAARCYKLRRHVKNRTPKNIVGESKGALINSRDSSLGNTNDIEIDGIDHHQKNVRGERPTLVNTVDELEAIANESTKSRNLHGLNLERVLGENDNTITVAADSVSGEKRHELFHSYLKLEKAKTDPEEELWHKGVVSFQTYILNVLKIWLQRADKNATLGALTDALRLADFHDVVEEIHDLAENQTIVHIQEDMKNNEREIVPENNAMSYDNVIDMSSMSEGQNEESSAVLYNPSTYTDEDVMPQNLN